MTINWMEFSKEFNELILQINLEQLEPKNILNSRLFFGNDEFGYVFLLEVSTKIYSSLLMKIKNDYSRTDTISEKYIEKNFNDAIIYSVDLNKKNQQIMSSQRIEISLNNFRRSLGMEAREYFFFFPIEGFSFEGLPWRIGDFEIFRLREGYLKRINLYHKESETPTYSQFVDQELELLKKQNALNKIYARVKVVTLDIDAAYDAGLKKLNWYLDIINFFVGLMPYSMSFIYLPGDAGSELVFSPIEYFENGKKFQYCHKRVGNLHDISISNLISTNKKNNFGLLKLRRIIGKPNELQQLILTSMQWAGRAWEMKMRGKKEDSFLYYMIALESLILPKIRSNLTYRMSIHISHLLSKDRHFRFENVKKIKKLYDLRSNIVHDGSCEITKKDLFYIEYLTRNAIIHIFRDKPFNSMKKVEDLSLWFEERILR